MTGEHDGSATSPADGIAYRAISRGKMSWATDVALPFWTELNTSLGEIGIVEASASINELEDWYAGPTKATAAVPPGHPNEMFVAIQFILQDGLGIWAVNRFLDATSARLGRALKSLGNKNRHHSPNEPRGIPLRIAAKFGGDQKVVALESDLDWDTDSEEIVAMFGKACLRALKEGDSADSDSLSVYSCHGKRLRKVSHSSAARARATGRPVRAHNPKRDPGLGELERNYLAAHPRATVGLSVCAFLQRQPDKLIALEVLARGSGASERLVRGLPDIVNSKKRKLVEVEYHPFEDKSRYPYYIYRPSQ